MIAGRGVSGVTRQVFFVSVNGFDFHDNLLLNHNRLMTSLSAGLTSSRQPW